MEFKALTGKAIEPFLEDLACLRIEVFKEFPYLYEGSQEYEREYLDTYINSPRSLVVLVYDAEKCIGATTCIPLEDESEEFLKPFLKQNIDISKVFYFGESIIKKDYRGNRIGHKFFEIREEHARKTISNLNYTAFCSVVREDTHPLKPKNYKPLNSFWSRMGYAEMINMYVMYPWRDVGSNDEDLKRMNFWLKKWS
jgi:GNAT superfamily N-acetyltransferase